MTASNPTGGTQRGTLRAPPTGNPYAPPVTMTRPQQGYQPRNPTQQAPQANYAYQSQYVAPIQRPQPQWAIPNYESLLQNNIPQATDSQVAYDAMNGVGLAG